MNKSLQHQQGVSLLVSMVILILITLIGVTALKSASVEEQMASNLYQKNVTFQASESAVENTIMNQGILTNTLSSAGPVSTDVPVNIPNTSASVQYMFVGTGPAIGYTQGVFSGARLMITSTAQNGDTRTRTVHGVVRLIPNPQ